MRVDVLTRTETSADHSAIRRVNEAAFGGHEEADLVDALRADGSVLLSLVAIAPGAAFGQSELVGHVMFSRMSIEGSGRSMPAVALGPVAVLPARQRQGVGEALIRDGLARLQDAGEHVVVVVGHDTYYPRFGFTHQAERTIEHPFPAEAFMLLELIPNALHDLRGRVRYPAPFGL